MDITISSPGSPGTSLTSNVKKQIVLMFDELSKNDDFESLSDLKDHLGRCGLNKDYVRNILPFLQFCGIVKYSNILSFENDKFFSDIGKAYINVLKSIDILEKEPDDTEKNILLEDFENIQNIIYFQCLVIMMKSSDCNYAIDFFDVLRFVYKYGYIDIQEYFLIIYERNHSTGSYIDDMAETIKKYRNGEIDINVKTETSSTDEGKVNSFPYVNGNFVKAGILYKEKNKFYIVQNRKAEIEAAIEEVIQCQNLAM
jgi:hypothetical protein